MTFRNPPTKRRASALEVDDIVHIATGEEIGDFWSGEVHPTRWRLTAIAQDGPDRPFTWYLVRVGDRKQVEHQFTPGTRGVYVAETVKKANPTVSRVSTHKATTGNTHHDHAHQEWKWVPPLGRIAGGYIL